MKKDSFLKFLQDSEKFWDKMNKFKFFGTSYSPEFEDQDEIHFVCYAKKLDPVVLETIMSGKKTKTCHYGGNYEEKVCSPESESYTNTLEVYKIERFCFFVYSDKRMKNG